MHIFLLWWISKNSYPLLWWITYPQGGVTSLKEGSIIPITLLFIHSLEPFIPNLSPAFFAVDKLSTS